MTILDTYTPHPVLPKSWTYDIVSISWQKPQGDGESYIELHLRNGDDLRRLRFFSPIEVEFAADFPQQGRGIRIVDHSADPESHTPVQVDDYYCVEPGPVRFYARHVIDLDNA